MKECKDSVTILIDKLIQRIEEVSYEDDDIINDLKNLKKRYRERSKWASSKKSKQK